MPRIGGSPRARLSYQPEEPDEQDPDGGIVVNLDDHRPKPPDTYEMRDGEAHEVGPVVEPGSAKRGDFHRNLALDYEEDFLDDRGDELCERIEEAIVERQPWRDRFERGLEMMGLVESDIDDGPFPGASNAVHPLLIEARTQFWARAMGELFPPEGPCKGKVEGSQTGDKVARAERVSEYMNFEMTILDEAFTDEASSMIWDLPFYGSTFFKTYRDPVLDQNVTIYVPADDMIVPAEAKSLATTPFFAHRMRKNGNELKKLQLAEYYRECELDLPSQEEQDEVQSLKDETQDVAPDGDEKSLRHELFETMVDWNLEGDEHLDEEGNETGLERSYIVTVDRHTHKILAIYRGWEENDVKCRRKLYFEHWRYCPGQGFYGSGLFHLIGGLQVAATGALRVLLDSAASASLSGGFISKHANLKGKRLVLTPGHWEPVDASAEDLQKAFYSPPVKEPAAALFQLLGFLTEQGKSYTSTTELMTGDQDPKGAPVGTTNMLLEQGGKVMSTIHRMAHNSLGRVLRLRYQLCQQFAPPDGYPYEVEGQQRTVYADDFAPGVSVVPVSDPNIFSSAQRISLAQAVLQTCLQTGVGNIKKAVKRFYQALRIPDVDELVPDDPEPQSYDPVGEIQALFLGKPVKVTPEQPHVMHLQVLAAFANNPQYGGNEQVQKQIGPGLLSIIGQHMAYAWATHARGLGVPAGYMDPQSGQMPRAMGSPEQIAAMLAQVAPALATVPGLPPIDPEGKDKGKGDEGDLKIKMAELEIKQITAQQQLAQDKEKHQWEMQRDKQKLDHEKEMQQIKAQTTIQAANVDAQVKQQEGQLKIQQGQQQAHIDQQMSQQKMAHDAQQMQSQQQMDAHKMHQEAQMGQQKMQHQTAQNQQKMQQSELQNQQKLEHTAKQQEMQATQGQAQPDRLQHLRPHKPMPGV